MINKLNIFSENTYVVAEEWNANFRVLNQSNKECEAAINDANQQLAFPDGDLSGILNKIESQPNSFRIEGSSVIVSPECEYYKQLGTGETLNIQIPPNFNSETRIAIRMPDARSLLPFSIDEEYFGGGVFKSYGDVSFFKAGLYFIMIYAIDTNVNVKLIWTRG